MKALAVVLNIFVPGVGSFVLGKVAEGMGQIIIWGLGFLLTITAIFSIIGIPMMLGAWIWGLITAIGFQSQPIQINVVDQRRS